MAGDQGVRLAVAGDAEDVASMLVEFAREFETPTEQAQELAPRIAGLIERAQAIVPLATGADGPLGFGILIPRPTSFVDGEAALLEELYVVPERRGGGIGSTLLELAIETARTRGVTFFEIGVDEPDTDAQRFYERHGFTNRAEDGSDARMLYFERQLD